MVLHSVSRARPIRALASMPLHSAFELIQQVTAEVDHAVVSYLSDHRHKIRFSHSCNCNSMRKHAPCLLGLSATGQPYFSLRTNQHQPSATHQTNRLMLVGSLWSPASSGTRHGFEIQVFLPSHLTL
jgi:hypothetical protein